MVASPSADTKTKPPPSPVPSVGDGIDMEWLFPRVALLGMAAVCGTNFPLVKDLELTHSESSVALVRFSLATLPFLGQLNASPRVAAAGFEIGLWCAVGYITQAIGLHLTEASKGAFICALFMIITPAVSPLGVAGKKAAAKGVPMTTWAAVALALLGTGLLETAGIEGAGGMLSMADGELLGQTANLADAVNTGDLWCLGTALGFGLMFARMANYMETMSEDIMGLTAWQLVALVASMATWFAVADLHVLDSLTPLLATSPELSSSAVDASVPGSTPTFLDSLLSWKPKEAAELVWMGLVTTAGVLWGETAVMAEVSAAEAGIIFATEPIWATGFSLYLLQESLRGGQVAGAGLILLGCVLSVLPSTATVAPDMGPVEDTMAAPPLEVGILDSSTETEDRNK